MEAEAEAEKAEVDSAFQLRTLQEEVQQLQHERQQATTAATTAAASAVEYDRRRIIRLMNTEWALSKTFGPKETGQKQRQYKGQKQTNGMPGHFEAKNRYGLGMHKYET